MGRPARLPHEYVRTGTAKLLTLLRPADGRVRVSGVTSCPNAVLHPWLRGELTAILAGLPADPRPSGRAAWDRWQVGLTLPITLPAVLPPLRVLLVLDNLAGHRTPDFVPWLFAHGVMPVYTPVGGSWRNMAESIQRVLKARALDGQQPSHTDEIIRWLEAVAARWNDDPTPFEWGGRRATRRKRQRDRRHRVGGSEATTRRPISYERGN